MEPLFAFTIKKIVILILCIIGFPIAGCVVKNLGRVRLTKPFKIALLCLAIFAVANIVLGFIERHYGKFNTIDHHPYDEILETIFLWGMILCAALAIVECAVLLHIINHEDRKWKKISASLGIIPLSYVFYVAQAFLFGLIGQAVCYSDGFILHVANIVLGVCITLTVCVLAIVFLYEKSQSARTSST